MRVSTKVTAPFAGNRAGLSSARSFRVKLVKWNKNPVPVVCFSCAQVSPRNDNVSHNLSECKEHVGEALD